MRLPGTIGSLAVWLAVTGWTQGCTVVGEDAALSDAEADGGRDTSGAGPDLDAPPPEALEPYIEWEMARHGIAGLAAAVVDAGGVRWMGTFGRADVETNRPVDEDTLFIVASVSKTVFTPTLLQLVEQGKLDLDAPVDDYLPFAVRHPDHPDAPITARMLLTHSSGLEDDFRELDAATFDGDPGMTLEEFTRGYVLPDGALYGPSNWGDRPGAVRSYANAGFGVLGYLVEVVGGRPLPEQSREGLLAPLSMDASGWFLRDVDEARLATPYTWGDASGYKALSRKGFGFYPASSFRTSITDLSRFLRAMIGDGSLDGVRVLEAQTVGALEQPQLSAPADAQALSWTYRTVGEHTYLHHSGATFGASANILYRPADGVGILLTTNSDAYVLARLGLTDGKEALERILVRLDAEADRLQM